MLILEGKLSFFSDRVTYMYDHFTAVESLFTGNFPQQFYRKLGRPNPLFCMLNRQSSMYSPFSSSGIENTWSLVCLAGKSFV